MAAGWGSDTALTQLTSITNTEQFFASVTSSSSAVEAWHVQVDINFVTTPTDDMDVAVYTTLDATTENWDDLPFMGPYRIDNGTDPSAFSFIIPAEVYKWRVGVVATGATDTHTSADLSYRVLTYS